jgi:predicted RNA binding protein YcfA (HicA-like mRNA interferase family)
MLELPIISGKEAIKIFGSLGFKIVRQKGSHAVLRKENKGCVIPIHKELAIKRRILCPSYSAENQIGNL